MMMMILLCIALVLSVCYYLFTRSYGHWKSKGVPFEKPVFIFGSLSTVALRKEHIFDALCNMYRKFKGHPYFGMYSFNRPTLVVTSPELLRKILVKDFDKFADRNVQVSEKTDPIAFHTLFSARGVLWKSMRSKISPVFTSGKLKLMFPLMQECADNLESCLRERSGKEIEFRHLLKKYAIDVISSCAFGINAYCLKDDNSEIRVMATKLLDFSNPARSFSVFCFFFFPKLSSLLGLTFVDKTASNYLMNVFKSTLNQREKEGIERHDLIDLLNNLKKAELLTDEYKFDDIKMASQAISFFSAGNDTTATIISFTLYELALNKDIQERLRKEVKETHVTYGSFTYEALHEMKYLDMILCESLRKYPLASFLNRQTVDDYKIEETGLLLEKGTSLMVPVCALHYDPEYFPNPKTFDPERFSEKNRPTIKPYTYMPFGEGPRNCIGQRFGLLAAKIAIAQVLKDFVLDPTPSTCRPIVFAPRALFLQSSGGIYLKATKI